MPFPVTLDTVLLIVLIGFIAWGFANGFIRAVGGIIGIFVAAAVAGRYYLWLAATITPFAGSYQGFAAVVAFVIIFLVVGRLFGVLVHLFEQAFDVLAFIPFLKSINRLAGAIFGLILGVLIVGAILFVAGRYSQWVWFNDAVTRSQLAQYALNAANILTPFFPDALRQLRSYF